MSYVLRLVSSRLASRVSRSSVVRVSHAHTLGGRARGSRALRFTVAILLTSHFSLLTCFAADAFIKLPPPVYGGLVKDYMQRAYSATSVEIFARRASDSKLLATSQTTVPSGGVNYALTIPMVNGDSTGVIGLQYGQPATLSFLDGDVVWANLATVTPTKPGYQRLDLTLCHDENKDGIADEYAAYMKQKMETYGIEGEYDPDADYNGDGITNREHYLAGTSPFDGLIVGGEKISEQVCTIASLMNVTSYAGDEYFAITFNAAEEVQYAVLALDDLSKGWGEATKVASREERDSGELEEDHWAEGTGEMTLYVPKGNEKQMFYKLVVGEW